MLSIVYNAHRKADLNHAESLIPDGVDDPTLCSLAMQKAADMTMEYSGMKLDSFYEF